MKKVFVLTGNDLGWDCVVGVYSSEEKLLKSFEEHEFSDIEEMKKEYPSFIITETVMDY